MERIISEARTWYAKFSINMYTLIRNKTQTALDKRIAKKTLAFTDLTVSYVSTCIFKSVRKLKILKYIMTVIRVTLNCIRVTLH